MSGVALVDAPNPRTVADVNGHGFRVDAAMLTVERERNLRRHHERLHPDGFSRIGRLCEVCLLLAALKDSRADYSAPAEDGESNRKGTEISAA